MCRYFVMLICVLPCLATAVELATSGKNDILENPTIFYGVNRATHVLTGYLVALRKSPGRTDECRFAFSGNLRSPNKFLVKYLSEIDGYEASGAMSSAVLAGRAGDLFIRIKEEQLGGECEWILPFIGGPRVKESESDVSISFGKILPGDWIGVFAIRSAKARFHGSPDKSSVQNAFLVQGDVIYVYDEKPGWYYVKYQERKKTIIGWVKQSDTVQIVLE
jgi:hypothetical protein